MAINTTTYTFQEVFEAFFFNLETNEMYTYLDNLKTSNWENTGEIVSARGGRGNTIISSFSHSKGSSMMIESATLSDGLFEMQTGTAVEDLTTTTEILYPDVVTISGDSGATLYTGIGTADAEIEFAYVLDASGAPSGTSYTQATVVSTTEFVYIATTKALTFGTGLVADAAEVLVNYYPTIATAKKVVNNAAKFAATVRAVFNGRFRDVCTDEDYLGQLVYHRAKIGENYNFDISADGDPAVHNLELTAEKACSNDKLWTLYIYESDVIS